MVKKIFLLAMIAIYIATWFIYYEEMGPNLHFHMLMWAVAIFGIYLYSFEKRPLPAFFWKRFITFFVLWQVLYLILYAYYADRYKIDADIGNDMLNFLLIIPTVFILYQYTYRILEQKPAEEEIDSCRKIFCWAGFALLIFSMAAFDDINFISAWVKNVPNLIVLILKITMLVGLFCCARGKNIMTPVFWKIIIVFYVIWNVGCDILFFLVTKLINQNVEYIIEDLQDDLVRLVIFVIISYIMYLYAVKDNERSIPLAGKENIQ